MRTYVMTCDVCEKETEHDCHLEWGSRHYPKPTPQTFDTAEIFFMMNKCICQTCGTRRKHVEAAVYFDMIHRFARGDSEVLL